MQTQRGFAVKNMLVHDLRLTGRSPVGMAQKTFDVADGIGTAHVLGWIGNYASSVGGLDNLFIMCNGYEHGLALGEPGLTLDNLQLTGAWHGKVATITLFACAPANSRPGYHATSDEGMRFCGELALITGADVIAAEQTPIHYMLASWWDGLVGDTGAVDFAGWTSPVYRFSASDGTAMRVDGPIERDGESQDDDAAGGA